MYILNLGYATNTCNTTDVGKMKLWSCVFYILSNHEPSLIADK